jgi:preprotein translocase subunit SecA
MKSLTDAELRQMTDKFRERLSSGETLDDLMPEAFAVVREASRRMLIAPSPDNTNKTMRHFDVQLIGGIVLHQGKIAEMATGEGKTLVATLPAYLNALEGKGVHIVTVNDYLADRDRNWMGPMYEFLGLSTGAIQSNQSYEEKMAAYKADITYGTNNEFGFDYLRDNMRVHHEEQVQGELNYAIVDEVDSILIDEARTPLIISGPSEESTEKYYTADKIARRLKAGKHYEVKEKEKSAHLTDEGTSIVEKQLGVDSIYADINMDWPHYIEQSLRAHSLFKRDTDYIVRGREVIIVDEFTGRLMEGRVWSDGLHQAVQAKERLKIKEENQMQE